MIQENSFRMNWNNNFPSALTYGLQLRDQYKEHWLRIHTLPNSKRYPDKSNHYKEILKRHDELMNDLFKPNSTLAVCNFWLLGNLYSSKAKGNGFYLQRSFLSIFYSL
jgi:hypothetical protein